MNNSKGVSYTTGFFLLIGFALVATVLVSFMALAVIGSPEALRDPSKADLLRLLQVASVLLSMFLPAVIVAYILNRKPFRLLGYRRSLPVKQVALVIAILFASLLVAGAFGYLNRQIPVSPDLKVRFEKLETMYNEQVAIMLNFKNVASYLISLVIMAFVPALCEETLFRGGLQNFMTRATRSPWISILVVSILFSLAHFSFYLFLPRFFLGVMLGSIYYVTKNIWLSIFAHFLNNAMEVTVVFVLTRQGKNMATALQSDVTTYYWGFLALPLFVFLLILLKRTAPPEDALITQTAEHGV